MLYFNNDIPSHIFWNNNNRDIICNIMKYVSLRDVPDLLLVCRAFYKLLHNGCIYEAIRGRFNKYLLSVSTRTTVVFSIMQAEFSLFIQQENGDIPLINRIRADTQVYKMNHRELGTIIIVTGSPFIITIMLRLKSMTLYITWNIMDNCVIMSFHVNTWVIIKSHVLSRIPKRFLEALWRKTVLPVYTLLVPHTKKAYSEPTILMCTALYNESDIDDKFTRNFSERVFTFADCYMKQRYLL